MLLAGGNRCCTPGNTPFRERCLMSEQALRDDAGSLSCSDSEVVDDMGNQVQANSDGYVCPSAVGTEDL